VRETGHPSSPSAQSPSFENHTRLLDLFFPARQSLTGTRRGSSARPLASLKTEATATLPQTEANRRNSQRSTGPRTAEGKSITRFNALKTGIAAKSLVIPGEDAAELEALAAGYDQQFQPATPLECFLVDPLVHSDWQLRRLHRVEAQLWTTQVRDATGDTPLGEAYARALDPFTRLPRRIDAAERAFFRAFKQLQRVQETAPAAGIDPKRDPATGQLASFFPVSDAPDRVGVPTFSPAPPLKSRKSRPTI
jgi:hypothetical protein